MRLAATVLLLAIAIFAVYKDNFKNSAIGIFSIYS